MLPSPKSSLDELLISGCDSRILLGADGLNKYGCRPAPRDVIPFGSCTSSSTTSAAFAAAGDLAARFHSSADPDSLAFEIADDHRARLRELLTLPNTTEIAFAPSGTDAELLALAIAKLRTTKPIFNIIVGPTEVGTGTPLAAAGCHYDKITPRGDKVTSGMPVNGALADEVQVCPIDIRDDRGRMLDPSLIDASVVESISHAVDQGSHVLLHVVAHSKTGVHAPSLACIERITRHLGPEVSIIIDAAQGRVSRRGLREILGAGHMVIFTGSKFYGGPPFSGALFVPTEAADGLNETVWTQREIQLLDGLRPYFTAPDVPEHWRGFRQHLAGWTNLGSLLRWSAALNDIAAYYSVAAADRLSVLRAFEQDVPDVLSGSDEIVLMPVFPPLRDDAKTRLLESKTTVFAFQVEMDQRRLGRDELRRVHRALNSNGMDLPQTLSGSPFHLGQPVIFRDGSAALRIALGGAQITRVANDEGLGNTIEQRLQWQRAQLERLMRTLQSVLRSKHLPS